MSGDGEASGAEEQAPDAVEPKKRRKRRKKRKKGSSNKAPASKPAASTASKAKQLLRDKFWVLLVVVGLLELFLFGYRGHVEVCVARDGVHDFALLGQERTDENTRRFPTCEKRLNIGITSGYAEVLDGATIYACSRANVLRSTTEKAICVIKADGWQHRVTTSWCPPWHDHYYKRLFWFAFPD